MDAGVQSVEHSAAALLHTRRSQRWEANHVTRGVDVRDVGAKVLVHCDQAALAGFDPCGCQIQVLGVALPPGGDQHGVDGK